MRGETRTLGRFFLLTHKLIMGGLIPCCVPGTTRRLIGDGRNSIKARTECDPISRCATPLKGLMSRDAECQNKRRLGAESAGSNSLGLFSDRSVVVREVGLSD